MALTALGAIKAGYKVTINTNAIGTMFHKRASKYNEKLKKLGASKPMHIDIDALEYQYFIKIVKTQHA